MSDRFSDDNNEDDEFDLLPTERQAKDEAERQSFLRSKWDRLSSEKLWLVSYSDFMTIMMIFFLAMFGYSHMVEAKREKLRVPLDYPEFAKLVQEMQSKLGDSVRVLDDLNKVTVELGEDVLFPSGSADLSDGARATLRTLAGSVGRLNGDIIVEGHTDDRRIVSRKFKTNWELSAARAFSVVDELSRAGIAPSRLAAWGFGENRPVAGNGDEDGRRRNRRINIVVLKQKAPEKG